MESQDHFDEITDIVVVSGSGGTGLDLAIANYWTGSKKKVHAIRTGLGDSTYGYKFSEDALLEAGITEVDAHDIIDIIGKPFNLISFMPSFELQIFEDCSTQNKRF